MSTQHRPAWVTVVCTAVAVACGLGMAAQARVNGELATRIENGPLAAFISFGTGLIIMIVAMAFSPAGRAGVGRVAASIRERSIPWFWILGGLGGAYLILSQGLVAATLGVALFSVGVVAGQTLSALVIDRRGLGSMAPKPITALRVIGALLALGAVIFAGSSQLHGDFPVWMLLLPFSAGIGIAWQQAFNGQIREVSGSAVTASFGNFVVGTLALGIATLVASPWNGWPDSLPLDPVVYLGGPIGVMFIVCGAIVVRYIGVLLLGLGMIAGQLLGSLVLDIVVPAAGHELGIPTIVSTIVTLVAVSLTALGGRPARAR
ncbi:DMT family transporter [Salinibacterium soli]|uniref:DMT family transporter n=1 Tax=Antiquaquibacter soli TaxID=3064523 RepID=A0ABT9BQT6_9MICO|nr:DMT family transporter [Protaetiibacter sp. WY-16]MDO7883401.1 DMT family transporter [Protaetiibacter sp. WY-16]